MKPDHFYNKNIMQGKNKIFFILFLVSFTLSLLAAAVVAEAAEPVGKFSQVNGRVDVLRGGELPAISVVAGDVVFIKDAVRTKSGSSARITFNDGNTLALEQRSRIDISEYFTPEADQGIIKLQRGKVTAVVAKDILKDLAGVSEGKKFEIHTPTAVAGVRGTCYAVSHVNNNTWVFSIDKPECPDPGTVYVYQIGQEQYMMYVLPGELLPALGQETIIPIDPVNQLFILDQDIIPFDPPTGKQGDFERIDNGGQPG
ncbi:MAG: FecR family protein [Thermodesulfovibrionia bacterium]|nr:FecR family protein [Thermodesulfovibrionia bacterium]